MSIITEIQRLQQAKIDIKTAIENKNIIVSNNITLDKYPQLITSIPNNDPYNGHDYVEIGGIKWATMNLGSENITDYGYYFAWGDTTGYLDNNIGTSSNDYCKPFNLVTYKFSGGRTSASDTAMIKYNSNDNKTTLDLSDDAAQANWGGSWRIPTTSDWTSLKNAVNVSWTDNYQNSGIAGTICIDKTDNTKSLFFPASGFVSTGTITNRGSYGRYWARALYSNKQRAYNFAFETTKVHWNHNGTRWYGFSIRPIIAS